MTQPLYCRMYLTAYDTSADDLYDRTRTGFLLRAAVLAELAIRGNLVDSDGDALVASPGPAGDPVLDLTLDRVASDRRDWISWIRHDRKETLHAVEDRLVAQGVLTVEEKRSLGRSRRAVTVTDISAVTALRATVTGLLHGTGATARIAPADAALVALAAAGGIRSVVSRSDARVRKDRIEELTGRLGAVAPGLGKAVGGLGMTLVAARGGMGGG
ncbi:GPP34 family phosphoprotein [Streptomyces dangxiongensis]|uniref:GPP34 family phosphoprotein n=1 Tax=Streptomyces dangxiongensis TaxID=1442032 RepID=A0A3G2JLV5_9ACTN|nr:GPP34 family phosphoprotein [Streptomyces dangxiongensis]AYN42601.1 GPP34 family phosphoprotein [Streptomyces dangxiongensis]